tara:strand:+ start:895 stop:1578 length:684 start_codon:yes stop_codon:yes gene_type:complete
MNEKMKQMRDEPDSLKGMKRVLEFFKPEGLQSLLLNLRRFKQGTEMAGAQTKMNLMNLVGEGGFTPDAEGFTAEDFEQQLTTLDSLGVEISKTDSLLNAIREKGNVEVQPMSSMVPNIEDQRIETDDIMKNFVEGMVPGNAVGRLTKVATNKLAKQMSGKFGFGKEGSKKILANLTQTDIDEYARNFFGQRDFYNLVKAMKAGRIKPGDKSYEKGQRVLKLYEELNN